MKLAIIGTGKIIPEVLTNLREIPSNIIEVKAICCRQQSLDKADYFSKEYNIPKIYTDYEELLGDDEIDFVYIALVNTEHYEYTKRALLAGKNVILEKPSTPSYKEICELAQMAVERGLYLFEAVTFLHMPNFLKIKEMLPKLGNIRLVQCNYSQYSSRYDAYKKGEVLPAFDPAFYGGALYDINIYNINYVVGLFGEPLGVNYTANHGFNGIDTSGTVVMKYQDFIAICSAAKDSQSPSCLIIQGDRGYIKVSSAPNVLTEFTVSVDGKTKSRCFNQYTLRMMHEFIDFAEMYDKKDYERMKYYLEISKAVIKTAEQAGQSAGISFGESQKIISATAS